tara:strand:- start:694 stop:1599 length:906 start_codon:yes stop_codon:yes gene_type:complete
MTKARDLANVISGSGTLNANVIPNLPTSKITSGTFADARLSSSSVTQHVDLSNLSASNLTSGTVPNARITLDAAEIPDIPASKITSGTLGDARIPNLATSKITSGTFDDARLSSSSITQHVDLSNLNASNLTSGSIPSARVASGAVTQHVSAVTNTSGSWSPSPVSGGFNVHTARYQKVGNMCMVVAQGRFNSRTSNNYSHFAISGLPFTSANVGLNVGSGILKTFRMNRGNPQVLIKPNETYIRFYGDGAYYNETTTSPDEYPDRAFEFIVFTNRQFFNVSRGYTGEDGWFIWAIYQTAS